MENMSEKKKSANLKPSKIVVSIFLIIFIFAVVFVVAQTLRGVPMSTVTQGISDFFDSLSAGPGYPYSKDTANIESVKTLDNQLVILANDKTYLLNTTAKETQEKQHTYSDPTLISKDGEFIVFDRGSGRIRYCDSKGIIWEKDMKQNVMAADMSGNSRVAVATRASATKFIMTVYSKKTEVLFQWNCTSGYIADVAISENGKNIAAIVISEKNAEIVSTLFIFAIDEKEPLQKIEYQKTALFDVSFSANSKVIAIGNNLRSTVTLKGERTDDDIFRDNKLASVAFDSTGTSVMQFFEYSGVNSNILVMTDENGKECARVKIDSSVKKVACGKKYFAAVLADKIVCFNKRGKQIGEIKVNNEVEEISIIGSKCYIFTSGVINRYSVRNKIA